MLDPTRLSQILINLITNALKFSGSDGKPKNLSITMSASRERPDYSQNLSTSSDPMEQDSLPEEDSLYLTFQVFNSGIGISASEAKLLFQRFQQATPKTHIEYGGWGML